MALVVALLVLALALLVVLAALSCRRYDTWRRKGVPCDSPLPVVGSVLRNLLQREPLFLTLHRIYKRFPGSPLVGFYAGPTPVLLVKDIEIIKQITVKDFHIFANHKLSPHRDIDDMFSKFLFCLFDDEWKKTRVKMTPSFSTGRLKSMYPTVRAIGGQFVDTLLDTKGGAVSLGELCSRYGLDVIGACAFGCQAGALRDPDASPYAKAVNQAMRLGPVEGLSSFLLMFAPLVYRLLRLPLMQEWRADILRSLLRQARQHREKEAAAHRGQKDIFDCLLQLQKDGEVPVDIFEAQVVAMQVAGSETSASTVMIALWEMARHPGVQERLRAEVQEAVKRDGGDLTYETMHELRYLDMVYKETLRLWPALPWLDRVCSEDYAIPGTDVVLERGTLVLVPMYSIHRDPDHFSDPDSFDPERFAERSGEKMAYMPFGSGQRMCIGNRFADMSVKSALCQILLNLRVSIPEDAARTPADLAYNSASFLIHFKNNFMLRFHSLQAGGA